MNIHSPLKLNLIEIGDPMPGGITSPRMGTAIDNQGNAYDIIMKLRRPSDSCDGSNGHFGGTSLACELICSILARGLDISVPDYCVVNISTEFVESMYDSSLKELFRKNIGDNFATVYREGFSLWRDYPAPTNDVLNQLADTIEFDSTLVNPDRKREKPNLLYRGEELLLIDHSLAIIPQLTNEEFVEDSSRCVKQIAANHCSLRAVQKKNLPFRRFKERWANEVDTDTWVDIKTLIPEAWEHEKGQLNKLFAFLTSRHHKFETISNLLCEFIK